MEDDVIVTTAETEEVPDWTEPTRVAPSAPSALPPSSDKNFWGDSTQFSKPVSQINAEKELMKDIMRTHRVQMIGIEFVCVSCPHTHSLPLDYNKFTVDHSGHIVTIDNKR